MRGRKELPGSHPGGWWLSRVTPWRPLGVSGEEFQLWSFSCPRDNWPNTTDTTGRGGKKRWPHVGPQKMCQEVVVTGQWYAVWEGLPEHEGRGRVYWCAVAHTHRQERTSCPHGDIPGAALMQRFAGRQHFSLWDNCSWTCCGPVFWR